MKKVIIPIICLCLLLNGCGTLRIYESYEDAIINADNDYFKSKLICYDAKGSYIIQNELTKEYFFVVSSANGVTMCPIRITTEQEGYLMSNDAIDDMESKSESMSYGAGVDANASTP